MFQYLILKLEMYLIVSQDEYKNKFKILINITSGKKILF